MEIVFKADLGGKPLSIQTGKTAKQASGSVVVQHGETIVLVTAVSAKEERQGIDFLPLSGGKSGGPVKKTPGRRASSTAPSGPCFPRGTGTKSRSSPRSFPWTRKTTRMYWP